MLDGVVVLPLVLLALAQAAVPTRRVQQSGSTLDEYGDPRPVELESIAGDGERRRDHVRTHGRLEPMQQTGYFILTDHAARVLVILGHGLEFGDLQQLIGSRVEVRGIVRALRPKEYVAGTDLDLIEDPSLPVLPAPRIDLPRVSLTVLGILDAERPGSPSASKAARGALAVLLAGSGGDPGKAITVLVQFRGRNLFGDLPKESQRSASDWVVKDGGTAAWVTGQAPRGKGFSLDPDYRSDSARWLEIVAKAEVVNGVLYLKASKVKLAPAPKTADPP